LISRERSAILLSLTSLLTRSLSLTLSHSVSSLLSLDQYPYFLLSVFVPSMIIASLSVIFLNNPLVLLAYFSLRTVSIFINISATLLIFYKIHRLRRQDPHFHPYSNPAYVLSMRLVYYCIVQTITRIGSSWYQLQYGFGSAEEYDASDASLLKSTVYLSEFILNPSAGIGYLVIFLKIQPEAWNELKRSLGCERAATGTGTGTGGAGKGPGKGSMKYQQERDGDSLTASPLLDDMSRGDSVHSAYKIFNERSSYGHGVVGADDMSSESERISQGEEQEGEGEDGNRGSNVTSSNPESLFPLLEMDEADLAKEIDRLYFNQPAYGHKW
jgi:hypothetical protein